MSYWREQSFERLERRMLLDAVPVGPEFRVNTFTTGRQEAPSIAVDAEGDFVVAWFSSGQDGDSYGIYAQRYNGAGVAQGAEFRVNSFTTAAQLLPSLAMDAQGDFVVAWQSFPQDFSGLGIYAQRYDASGVGQGTEFRVNSFTTDAQSFPSVAMDADGDFVVAWQSFGQDGSGEGIHAQRYNASGVAQGSEFRVNTFTPNHQGSASVAMEPDGNFVVAWQSFLQDGSGYGVYAQRYNALGVAQGSEFRVNSVTTGRQEAPSIAMDADGDFVVAWFSVGQDESGYGIYAQRYNALGVAQGAEFRVNSFTSNDQRFPSIAIDGDGDFVVAWHSSGQDGSGYGIYAQRYNALGVAQGSEFRVNTFTTNSQSSPAVAMDSDGDFVVTWHSSGQDGSLSGVYAQRYAVVPNVTTSTFLFESSPHRLSFTFDENVGASLGADDIVLENLTTMQTIPSSDFSLSYNPVTNTATFSYTGSGSSLITGVLPDGNYRATLLAAGITTPNGMPLAANYLFDFFFLNGDANRDGRVNLDDFDVLAANFGQSPRVFTHGDFTYDGVVNLDDFNVLAGSFGDVLGPTVDSRTVGMPVQSHATKATPFAASAKRIGASETREDPLDELLA